MPTRSDTKEKECEFCSDMFTAKWHGWKWTSHCKRCRELHVWFAGGGRKRKEEMDAQKALKKNPQT